MNSVADEPAVDDFAAELIEGVPRHEQADEILEGNPLHFET